MLTIYVVLDTANRVRGTHPDPAVAVDFRQQANEMFPQLGPHRVVAFVATEAAASLDSRSGTGSAESAG